MAPHRKIPLFLLPILLILLAGAVVLLVRGQPLTLERIGRAMPSPARPRPP